MSSNGMDPLDFSEFDISDDTTEIEAADAIVGQMALSIEWYHETLYKECIRAGMTACGYAAEMGWILDFTLLPPWWREEL